VTQGPIKLLLDDAQLPELDGFVAALRDAHTRGRSVAVHCVTRTQAAFTVAALSEAGSRPGDRMEHGAVLGPDLLGAVRRLGVIVVTQPGFVRARGDQYLADVEPDDLADLWRVRSLLDARIQVAFGTDAPFGPSDPWAALGAAASRTTDEGALLGPEERIAPRRAAALFCSLAEQPATQRSVSVGGLADLMVLAEPLSDGLITGSPTVRATIVGGTVVHEINP
jgi:predicted amidohydrolase YtcJ